MLKEFYTPQEALWCMDMPRNEFFDAQRFAARRARSTSLTRYTKGQHFAGPCLGELGAARGRGT